MTRQLHSQNAGTATGKWFRAALRDSHTGLVVVDIDTILYVFHDFKLGRLMLVEEKAHSDTIHTGQGLLMGILSRVLAVGCQQVGLDWCGYHVLRMSGACPTDSERIQWDGRDIAICELIEVLNSFIKDWRCPHAHEGRL